MPGSPGHLRRSPTAHLKTVPLLPSWSRELVKRSVAHGIWFPRQRGVTDLRQGSLGVPRPSQASRITLQPRHSCSHPPSPVPAGSSWFECSHLSRWRFLLHSHLAQEVGEAGRAWPPRLEHTLTPQRDLRRGCQHGEATAHAQTVRI